jgi:hypothetical protein
LVARFEVEITVLFGITLLTGFNRVMPKSSTTFTKGKSGNPSGRPKEIGHVRDLARKHTS